MIKKAGRAACAVKRWRSQFFRTGICGLVALLVPLLYASPSQAAEVMKFCFESADVHPWRTVGAKGLNFELINAAAKKAGVQVEYLALPWKRCLAELKANAVAGAFAASFKADRLEMGAYPGVQAPGAAEPDASKRLYMDSYVVVRKKGASVQWDGKSFSALDGTVGIQLGYSVGDQLKALGLVVDDGSTALRELVLKLLAGRVGAIAIGGSDAKSLALQEPKLARQIEVLPIPLVEKPYYLLVSHQVMATRAELATRLWQAIEQERLSVSYRKAEERAFKGAAP